MFVFKDLFNHPNVTQKRRRLDFASLQIRLTLGVTIATLAVFAVTVGWMMWKTGRMLSTRHRQLVADLTQQMFNDLETHGETTREGNLSLTLQSIINRLSTSNVWIWVRGNDQQILAQSPALSTVPLVEELLASPPIGSQPQTLYLDRQVIMMCSFRLKQQGNSIGQVYIAQDVTQDYAMLKQLTWSLKRVSLGAIALLCLFMAWFIRRSLRPLNHLKEATLENTSLPAMDVEEVPTEVRELARTYNQLRDRLSAANLKQQQFTHSLSHELRTPLSLVYGYLQSTLKRSPNLTESQQEALSIAALETENMIQLLQALLESTRLEGTLSGLHLEPVQVNAIAEEVIRMVQQFDHRIVQLEATESVMAIADSEALRRVLVQLLGNAVRYSAVDQPIVLRLFQRMDQVIIQVIDRGCGIHPSQQLLIFEPLYRVEPSRSRNTGGVGLGLSMVRSLVEGMGGTISVASELDTGSTFTVALRRVTL